jgi:hypothetical protein
MRFHKTASGTASRFRLTASHDCAEQVVRQQVSPNLFVNHLGRLATQDVHLHDRLDRADIEFATPPPFKQIADLLAVDRDVENRGHDFELFGAVVFVAVLAENLREKPPRS